VRGLQTEQVSAAVTAVPLAALCLALLTQVLRATGAEVLPLPGPPAARVLVGMHLGIVLTWAVACTALLLLRRLLTRVVPVLDNYPTAVLAVLVALFSVWPLWLVGTELTDGAWIRQQRWAPLARVAPAALLAPALATLPLVLRWLSSLGAATTLPTRHLRTAVLLVGALGLLVADRQLVPGTYASFHLLCYALSALLLWLVFAYRSPAQLGSGERPRRARVLAHAGVLLACLVAAPALVLASTSAGRAAALQLSPIAEMWVSTLGIEVTRRSQLHSELALLDAKRGDATDGASLPRGLLPARAPNGKPWNICLVVVDALRADVLPPVRGKRSKHARQADTPRINRWAEGNMRFSNAYSQASATHRSMPPMFRSLHPHDDPEGLGTPIASAMRALGRVPVAVVNNYFVEPRIKVTHGLLEGFDVVAPYERKYAENAVARTREVLRSVATRPFFLWIHVYNMHAPGYDGQLLSDADGSLAKRYRRSLRWLDGHLLRLTGALEEAGVAEHTVVVLASDHGEALGANGIRTHGSTAYQEEIRVPLQFHVPGLPGRVVDEVVTNVDVLPTLFDLLGQPPVPEHRGRSLAPLLVGKPVAWAQPYYIENGHGNRRQNRIGIIDGHDKLIYQPSSGVFMRFDIDRDPTEDDNLYDEGSATDRRLRRHLLRFNPRPFAGELADDEVRDLLLRRLGEVPIDRESDTLAWLLQLAALGSGLEPSGEGEGDGEGDNDAPPAATSAEMYREVADRMFAQTASDGVRALIAHHLFDSDRKHWSQRLEQRLGELADTPGELDFVRALVAQGQGPFAVATVAGRIAHWARRGQPEDFRPWLLLTERWPAQRSRVLGQAYRTMLERLRADAVPANRRIRKVLLAVAGLRRDRRGSKLHRALARQAEAYLPHTDMALRRAAAAALTTVGDATSLPLLQPGLVDPEQRVRQRVLAAFAAIEGDAAVPRIIDHGKRDPLLTMDAIKLLGERSTPAALGYLQQLSADHPNRVLRKRAKAAARKVERRLKRGRKK